MRTAMGMALVVCASVGGIRAEVPAGAVDIKDPAAAGRLVEELGDKDLAVRERGQRELDAVPVAEIAELRELARGAGGAEAGARLQERIEEMEGILALNPTRYDFDFDNLDGWHLAAELQRQTGARTTIGGQVGLAAQAGERFSLHAKGMRWDEAIAALSKQNPLAPLISSTSVNLFVAGDSRPAALFSHGAVVSTGYVHVEKEAANAGETEKLDVPVSVMVDPRAKLLTSGDARMAVRFVDSGKHFENEDGPSRHEVRGAPGWERVYTFDVPRGLSGAIDVRGQVKLAAQMPDERMEIDAAKHVNEEIRFGGQVVKVTKFLVGPSSQPAWKSLTIALESRKDPDYAGARMPEGVDEGDPLKEWIPLQDGSVTASVVDGQGRQFTGYYMVAGGWKGGDTLEGAFAEPLKVVLWRRMPPREMVVPFEFKNVAVAR